MKILENMDTTHTSASSWWRTSSFGVSFAREQLLDWKNHMKLVLRNKKKMYFMVPSIIAVTLNQVEKVTKGTV